MRAKAEPPRGEGWQRQRLCSLRRDQRGQRLHPLGRGLAGAKAVLPRGGAGGGKGCLYLEEAKLASESSVHSFFHLNINI